jgi:hypothetical protein
MKTLFQVLLFWCLVGFLACEDDPVADDDDGNNVPTPGMLLEFEVSGVPKYMKPLDVSFSFREDPDLGWDAPDTLIVNASVERFRPMFELVSGDSSWTDTLYVGDTIVHAFTIRPLVHGARFICASARADVGAGATIGGYDCVEIKTP